MSTRVAVLGSVLVLSAVVGLVVGAVDVGFGDVVAGILSLFGRPAPDNVAAAVVADIRVPRVLGAIAAGAALGVGGTVAQSAYRNEVAEPYLLGLASAAGFGFVVATLLVPSGWPPVAQFGLAALGAAGVAIALRRLREQMPYGNGLILVGVAVGLTFLAWTLLVTFAADSPRLPTFTYFVFGSLGAVGWPAIAVAIPGIALAWVLLARRARSLDLIALGDADASALGIDVDGVGKSSLSLAGLLTAASVVLAGVVGFIGLVAPLLARRLVGNIHSRLIPVSGVVGGLMILWSDTMIRAAPLQVEIPLGVVTAAVGGPILVAMMMGAVER